MFEDDGTAFETHLALGRLYRQQGRLVESAVAYSKALAATTAASGEQSGDANRVIHSIAKVAEKRGDLPKAMSHHKDLSVQCAVAWLTLTLTLIGKPT